MTGAPDSLAAAAAAQRLLPATLWELPVTRLGLADDDAAALAERGVLTVGDALADDAVPLPAEAERALRDALARTLDDGLRQFASADVDDWQTLRAQLLGPLDDDDRRLLVAAVGIGEPPRGRRELEQLLGGDELEERLQSIRSTLMQRNDVLLKRVQDELDREFDAFDGVLLPSHAAEGSVVALLDEASDDDELGLRLASFCLPHRCHLHRGALHGIAPRRFRELLRALPPIVPQHCLPLAIDAIQERLGERGVDVPRGVLMHVLRTELHTAIELDGDRGEVAVPDPRTPAARLVEILTEFGEPATLADLVFAYRERFRFASQSRLLRHLSTNQAFLRVGDDSWSLRQWHEQALTEVAEVVEQVARKVAAADQRQSIPTLVRELSDDERAVWLVLDRLADDPRVRLLGRGEACAADLKQSSVMRRLQRAFRRAAGDVVKSLFVSNQPEGQRRLVERLLDHNRAFVQPEADRIDTLTNYPFNQERMQRLIKLVLEHLQTRAGYAPAEALKDVVDATDLGGKWLSPELLADILRRNGPFEVLPPNVVALSDLSLPSILARSARQALRAAGEALTVEDVLRARPDLAEFSKCLAEVLKNDPLVQTPDGCYFVLT